MQWICGKSFQFECFGEINLIFKIYLYWESGDQMCSTDEEKKQRSLISYSFFLLPLERPLICSILLESYLKQISLQYCTYSKNELLFSSIQLQNNLFDKTTEPLYYWALDFKSYVLADIGLKGQCHEILYLFFRSNKLNQYFLNGRRVFLNFFLSCCVAVRIENIFLLLWKLLNKSDDFTVSRFRISVAAYGFSWKVISNQLKATK
jgi:hypothetical protein